MKKSLFLVLAMVLTSVNADAQFGNLVNKAKNAAKSAVTEKAREMTTQTKQEVKQQVETKVEETAVAVAPEVFDTKEGIPGNEMTSWAYAKDIKWEDITPETTAQDMMAAAINQLKIDKRNWETGNRTEIFKYENDASRFFNAAQSHPRTAAGTGAMDNSIHKDIEDAKSYWFDKMNKEGWNHQMDLAGLQSPDAPETNRKDAKSYYKKFMWLCQKAEAAENPMEKVFDIHQAVAIYKMCCQFYDVLATTGDTQEYKDFRAEIEKLLSETQEAQSEYGCMIEAPATPAELRAEWKAWEVKYEKQKAEERAKAAAQYKDYINQKKAGSNPAIEKLANEIYSKHCADGRKAVYTVSMNPDYTYDKTVLGQIIDRFWTVLTVFKMPDGTYRMQNFSIKWMYQGGGKYSSTAQMRGIGTLTVMDMPWQ